MVSLSRFLLFISIVKITNFCNILLANNMYAVYVMLCICFFAYEKSIFFRSFFNEIEKLDLMYPTFLHSCV